MAEGQPPAVPGPPTTLPWFTSCSWEPYHYELYQRVYQLVISKALFFNSESARNEPPFKFKTPDELRQEIDLSLPENPDDHDTLLEYFTKVIEYSPHRSHPFYLGLDGTSLDPYAIAGDFAADIMSTAVVTYLFAPVFTLQEANVHLNMRTLIGYPNPDKGDGVVTPGGGFATAMAIAAATNYKYPDIRDKGFGVLTEPSLAVYASENCNEFVEKACIVAGLGTDSLYRVNVDSKGRMDVRDLKQKIQRNNSRGIKSLFVIATIGTDTCGAIDPTGDIAQVCQDNDIWYHIDGTHGGPLLLSDEYRTSKLPGIEKSHSFILGGSGMLGTPYCFTAMVSPYTDQFFKTFGVGAEVVFEPTLLYDSTYDNGDHTVQTSRRGDISKFWLIWKAKGRNGISQHLNYIMTLATQFNEEIKKRSGFHAIMPQIDSNRVIFYYVPSQFRIFPRRTDYLNYQMTNVSRKIKNNLVKKGSAFLGLSKVRGYPECFAVNISNSATTIGDLKYVLDEIESTGRESTGLFSTNPWLPFLPLKRTSSIPNVNEVGKENVSTFATPPPPQATYSSYVNSPIEAQHQEMFVNIAKLFDENAIYFQDKRADPVLLFQTPEELMQSAYINLADEPSLPNGDVIEAINSIIRYSIHQPHPHYIYQLLSSGLDPYTIMTDFITTTMTSNQLTYEDGPLYTLMEEEILKASRKRIGFPESGDGMVIPGGTAANIASLIVARISLFPETKRRGLDGWRQLKLTVYVSKNAHYCFQKGALLQGLGLDNVVLVDPDADGRMDVNKLKEAIAKTKADGGTPFFVGATAGTTVLGIFDPLGAIAQVVQENNMWMHIDGSVGGCSMFSDFRLQDKLADAHLADSMNYNPHKWFGSTQELTILMFKQGGIVKQTLGTPRRDRGSGGVGSSRNGSEYDNFTAFGDLAAHAGMSWERRPNVMKMWMLWKAKGRTGLEKHIEYTYASKEFALQELKKPERQPMFRLVKQNFEFAGVCFWYRPVAIRDMDENSTEYKQRLNKVALPLQARLVNAGITLTPVFRDNGGPLFTKLTLLSSGITSADIVYLFNAIDYYGQDLQV